MPTVTASSESAPTTGARTITAARWVRAVHGASWFVWGVWLLVSAGALAFVARYGRNVPFYDEWSIVPVLAGDQAVDLRWLWAGHNGHCVPFPRLVLLGLYHLSGCDFRVGMYFNTLGLSALAFAMIEGARRLRGESSYADAFFPLVLLHGGHYENLLWSWQVIQVIPVLMVGALLLVIVNARTGLAARQMAGAATSLALLPLCGVLGLVYAPALAVWVGCVAVYHWRISGRYRKWHVFLIVGLVLAAAVLGMVYFVAYRESYHVVSPNVGVSLETGWQFLAGSFGPVAPGFWPLSGFALLGLLLPSVAVVSCAAWREPWPGRLRALGLGCFCGGVGCLVASVGLGRPGAGFTPRYFLMAVPVLCWTYFVWEIYGPRRWRPVVQMTLFMVVSFGFAFNVQEGRQYGRERRAHMDAVLNDLGAQAPVSKVLAHHAAALCPWPYGEGAAFHHWLGDFLLALHRAGIGPFGKWQPQEPAYGELAITLPPAATSPTPGASGTGGGQDSHVLLSLRQPRFVYGMRVHYAKLATTHWRPVRNEGDPLYLQVFWKVAGQRDFSEPQHYTHSWSDLPEERTVTFWIYDCVDQFRIHPGNVPDFFRLLGVVLLVPVEGEEGGVPNDP